LSGAAGSGPEYAVVKHEVHNTDKFAPSAKFPEKSPKICNVLNKKRIRERRE